jgi:anaerobic ribonucleoside-triphosphate reductase activating protein
MRISHILAWAASLPARRGLTISGGEPLQQAPSLLALLEGLNQLLPFWDILLYTGYSVEEFEEPMRQAVSYCDCVVSGRFVKEQVAGAGGLLSSTNQRLLFPRGRISATEVQARQWELELLPGGGVRVGGFPPPNVWLRLAQAARIQGSCTK